MSLLASRLVPSALVSLVFVAACSGGGMAGPGGPGGRGGGGAAGGTGGSRMAGSGGTGGRRYRRAGGASIPPLDAATVLDSPTTPRDGDTTDGGAQSPDTGSDPEASSTPGGDAFGVRRIYPTKAGGREWYLPANAEQGNGEWAPGSAVTRTPEAGVFHIEGSPRLAVASRRASPGGATSR